MAARDRDLPSSRPLNPRSHPFTPTARNPSQQSLNSDGLTHNGLVYPATPPSENYYYDPTQGRYAMASEDEYGSTAYAGQPSNHHRDLEQRSISDRGQAALADLIQIRQAGTGQYDASWHRRINAVQDMIRTTMRQSRRLANRNRPGRLPLLRTPETPPDVRSRFVEHDANAARELSAFAGPAVQNPLDYRTATHQLFHSASTPSVSLPSQEPPSAGGTLTTRAGQQALQYHTDDPEEIPHSPESRSPASQAAVIGEHNPGDEDDVEPQVVRERLSLARDAEGRPTIRGTRIPVSTTRRAMSEPAVSSSPAVTAYERGRIIGRTRDGRYVWVSPSERAFILSPCITQRPSAPAPAGVSATLDNTYATCWRPLAERTSYSISTMLAIRDRLAGYHDAENPIPQTPPHAGPSRMSAALGPVYIGSRRSLDDPTLVEIDDGRRYSPQGEAFLDIVRRGEQDPVTPRPRLPPQPIFWSPSNYSRSIGGTSTRPAPLAQPAMSLEDQRVFLAQEATRLAENRVLAQRAIDTRAFESAVRARIALHAPRQSRLDVHFSRVSASPCLISYNLSCYGITFANAMVFDWRSGRNIRRAWSRVCLSRTAIALLGRPRCLALLQLEV